jgi:hypothetical protein
MLFPALFAVHMLVAVSATAFDPHNTTPSATCPICFMGASLFSAVSSSSFAPEVPISRHYICSVQDESPFSIHISVSLAVRGPPPPQCF